MGNHTRRVQQDGAGAQPGRLRRRIESATLAAVMAELGCEPDLKLFRNNCGVAEYGSAKVRYGLLPGSADLIGVLAPRGRLISLEVKAPAGTLTP